MVLVSGCFDGIHAGHVDYLNAAKALCHEDELLVCAVAPDAYITASKGRKPYWPQHARTQTVNALQVVDAAVSQVQASVASVIRHYRPRLFVKGPDWQDRLPEDVQLACHDTGTCLAFVNTPGTHVSDTRVSDKEALARFEEVALRQSPATEPWRPVTPFDFESRKAIEGIHPQLIMDVFRPSHVLDVGCGPGHLIKLLKEAGATSVTGADLVTRHAEISPMHPIIAGDIACEAYWPTRQREFDLVICREVLEHLTVRQISRAVRNLCLLSSKYVYVTTRFAKDPAHLLTVDTSDTLDPTHISMLNQTFLRALFVLEGFKRRADMEAQMDHRKLGRVLVYERA